MGERLIEAMKEALEHSEGERQRTAEGVRPYAVAVVVGRDALGATPSCPQNETTCAE